MIDGPATAHTSISRVDLTVNRRPILLCNRATALFQVETMRAILRHSAALAWLFDISFSSLLACAAAAAVLLWRPAAGGSGVPEVMAYLNGCELRRVFDYQTAAAKFFSCALAVSSGLPVGAQRGS